MEKPKVLVRVDLTEDSLEQLKNVAVIEVRPSADGEELLRIIEGFEAIVCTGPERYYTEPFFQAASKLRILARVSAGVDMVDVDAATRNGVMVTNAPGANATSVAEMGILLILALSRKLIECDRTVRSGQNFRRPELRQSLRGFEIQDKKLGIVGFGAVGRQVARRALGLGLVVSAYDPYLDDELVRTEGALPRTLYELLRESDYLMLCCPLTDDTRGMINQRRIEMMKTGAYLINIARGGLVVQEDLADALETNKLAGAALDVTTPEPPPTDDPLFKCKGVIFSAHQGGNTEEAWERICQMAVKNVVQALNGERPQNLVNPEVLS
ncbi:MAG: hypothetical protein JRH18_24850 [Deltaproteobacteria bacterium]|nr:hypothetical protein [Deltaproteobacteria bacterium]MBW1962403.1 hypothetical protein [Deltaproteobacteria bacterium]MBW2154875.1 hypothetical protein [Deltaproteobacteria bacterium]